MSALVRDLARQRDSALARAEAAEKERDEALADGVLSQRMCDVLNARDAYRSMLCDVLASHPSTDEHPELWGRVRSILKHGPVIPSRAAEPT